MLCACGGNSKSSQYKESTQYTNIDHTPFVSKNEKGDKVAEVTLDSWSYLPEGLYIYYNSKEPYTDLQKGLVLTYTFTNYLDDPKQFQYYYYVYGYQNGRELGWVGGKENVVNKRNLYPPLDDWNVDIMDGRSITIAQGFELEDNSPVTIIIRRQSYHDDKDNDSFKTTIELK